MLKKSIHLIESWIFIQFHSFKIELFIHSYQFIWYNEHWYIIESIYISLQWLSISIYLHSMKSIGCIFQSFISITNIIDYNHSFLFTLISMHIDFNTIINHSFQTHYSFFTTKSLIWIDKRNQSRSITQIDTNITNHSNIDFIVSMIFNIHREWISSSNHCWE